MANEVPIPPLALSDPNSFEVFRVWFANRSMYMGLGRAFDTADMWGVVLAAAAKQASIYYGNNQKQAADALRSIQIMFNDEVNASPLFSSEPSQ